MNLMPLISKDLKRRVVSTSSKYLIIFSVLSLGIPFLNYFMGDPLDFADYLGAMNFIFPILLPILAVNFVTEDQNTRIRDFFFKTRKGRTNYLLSLFISAFFLGILAGCLLLLYGLLFQLGFQIEVLWDRIALSFLSYILCSVFYLSIALILAFFAYFEGVSLMLVMVLSMVLLPIIISIGASYLGLEILFSTPFYLFSFLGMSDISFFDCLFAAIVVFFIYLIELWKIKRIDF